MRIGILGAGAMGETHAPAYQNIVGTEVAAIYARTQARAGPLAQKMGCLATTQLGEILGDPSIDAVDVCVPSSVHQDFVIKALAAGKHVFCETPFALTIEHAESMIEAARVNDRLLMVALLMRSVDDYQYIKRAVTAGDLGRTLAVQAYRLGSYLRPDSSDFKDHYTDPTTELMTFDFDVINWLFGQPKTIHADASLLENGTPGHVVATLRYDDFIATVEASGIMPVSFPFSVGLRVVGERGMLETAGKFVGDIPQGTFTHYGVDIKEIEHEGGDPYEAECRHFVECVLGNADPELLSAERALEALKMSVATQASLRLGRAIDLTSNVSP